MTDDLVRTPLHDAIRSGATDIAHALIALHDIDVNAQDRNGDTPLHLTVHWNRVDIAHALLARHDVDVNATEHEGGRTPLHMSMFYRATDITHALLAHRDIHVNTKTAIGNTPLHFAIINERLDVVDALLARADVDAKDNTDRTLLHFAVQYGRLNIVRVLLARDGITHVDAKDKSGRTPLHYAAMAARYPLNPAIRRNATDIIMLVASHVLPTWISLRSLATRCYFSRYQQHMQYDRRKHHLYIDSNICRPPADVPRVMHYTMLHKLNEALLLFSEQMFLPRNQSN